MRKGVIISLVVHGAVVGWYIATYGGAKPFDTATVDEMVVDLVPAEEVDQTKPEEAADAAKPAQKAAPDSTPDAARSPGPEHQATGQPDASAPPVQTAPTSEPERRATDHADAKAGYAVLADVSLGLHPDAGAASSWSQPEAGQLMVGPRIAAPLRFADVFGMAASRGADMEAPPVTPANPTEDEIAALKAHLQECWSVPANVMNAGKLRAVLRVSLAPDGNLSADPVLVAASASADGPALVTSAVRALRQCQPYSFLPTAKYQDWKVLDLTFSPQGMSDH